MPRAESQFRATRRVLVACERKDTACADWAGDGSAVRRHVRSRLPSGPPGFGQVWTHPRHFRPCEREGVAFLSIVLHPDCKGDIWTRYMLGFLALSGCKGARTKGKMAGESVTLRGEEACSHLQICAFTVPRWALESGCLALHAGSTSTSYVALGKPLCFSEPQSLICKMGTMVRLTLPGRCVD